MQHKNPKARIQGPNPECANHRTIARSIRFPLTRWSAPGVPFSITVGAGRIQVQESGDKFNLLESPWIPVLYHDGRWQKVDLCQAVRDADHIRHIAATNPMDRVAILRFLIAVFQWCRDSTQNGPDEAPIETILANCVSKLEEHADCFNLLGEGKRFYQSSSANRSRAATDLLQEIPTGNNFWHFRHSIDGMNGLCPSCCAMGLLRLPLFSVSGLPDLKAGINGSPPIYVVPLADTLLKTLQVNVSPCAAEGTPSWISPGYKCGKEKDIPILVGLTLLSRMVWLHDPTGPPNACTACGVADNPLIYSCEFQSAGEQRSDNWNDPHVVYSKDEPRKSSKAPDLTVSKKFKMDRPWSELFARIIETRYPQHSPLISHFLLVGFATDKAKNIDVWERTVPVSTSQPPSESAPALFRQWDKESFVLSRKLRPAIKSDSSRKHDEIPSMLSAIRPSIEERVSAAIPQMINGGPELWEAAAAKYSPLLNALGKSLAPGYSVADLKRRKQIGRARPNMEPAAEPIPKKEKKGGGGK
jgi:hypothetical protein